MDTTTIIALVVAALVIVAVIAFVLSRTSDRRRLEREVERRREAKVVEHREEAGARELEAERFESAARAKRAEAEAHTERASQHERGLADDHIVREVEAERTGDGDVAGTDDTTDRSRFARDTTVDRDGAPIEPQRRV
jgi:flagellar biosynthesis/type III secretory pathway M-ring protein FliF/YscJ